VPLHEQETLDVITM